LESAPGTLTDRRQLYRATIPGEGPQSRVSGYSGRVGVTAFLWMMLVLKIPLLAALWIVWWSVRAEPEPREEAETEDDGGSPHPRPRRPGPARRGPHGHPTPSSPRRVRALAKRRAARRSRTSMS